MEEILEKISQYDIVVTIIPGYAICYFFTFIGYDLHLDDTLDKVIFYYIVGMLIGRIGSLIIEPVCKKFKLVQFADYGDYVKAAQKNEKISVLSAINNLYRNFIATSILIGMVIIGRDIYFVTNCHDILIHAGIVIAITILFLFAYRKQTNYIRKRVSNCAN